MKKIVTLLCVGAAFFIVGCGDSALPPMHPLELVFPQIPCGQEPHVCVDWATCGTLGIDWIQVEVGPSGPEGTKVLCGTRGGPVATVNVYYQPDQAPYIINATYTKKNSVVIISSVPFGEDEMKTPWKLNLQ